MNDINRDKHNAMGTGKTMTEASPALDFIRLDPRARPTSGLSDGSFHCTQHAGDVIYVPPLWGHATLNVKQSIGVAHEFSVESFCFE